MTLILNINPGLYELLNKTHEVIRHEEKGKPQEDKCVVKFNIVVKETIILVQGTAEKNRI